MSKGSAERAEDISKADIKRSIAFTPAEEMLTIVRAAEIKIVKTATVTAEEDGSTSSPTEGGTTTGGSTPSGGNEMD